MKKPIPFGKYDLLERINVGGMAEVFRAKAYGVEGFERLVAVKRILPNIAEDNDFITMFVDEAKIAVQLNHANIAQIFDLGVVDGSYFIALEHVHGRDLRAIFERCRQHGEPMPVAQACFVVMKLCEGLDYAHNKRDAQGRDMNLVHRDVSPQNILVSFEGEIKIIDFGIAKAAGKVGKTQAGILKGKFGYMSPEQVRGLPIDRRSDIFSTGIVLYELLTSERLFVGESDFSTLEKVRNVEILPPSTYNRRIPDELERIVLKALARDVDDRYANAIDLHDELQAFVYTAGEFYSRKDLAAWMKRTFAREIEEETAKIESYRQVPARAPAPEGHDTLQDRPAHASPAPSPSQQKVTTSHRRATVSIQSAPPPPAAAPAPQNGRPRRTTIPPPAPAAAFTAPAARAEPPHSLEWDDDELETKIYDQPPAAPVRKKSSPSAAFVTAPIAPALDVEAPDFADPRSLGSPPVRARVGRPSSNGVSVPAVGSLPPREPREPSFEARGTIIPDITVRRPPTPAKMWVLVAVGAVGLAGLTAGGYWIFSSDTGPRTVQAVVANTEPKVETAPPPPPAVVDKDSGFDIKTDPPAAKVRLDGSDIGSAPLRVRSLLAGKHQLEVSGISGYKPAAQEIVVEQGKALELEIKLERSIALVPVNVKSVPAGAKVTLVDGAQRMPLGTTPIEAAQIDPSRPYDVVFELDGYAAQTRKLAIGATAIDAELAKVVPLAAPPSPPPPVKRPPPPVVHEKPAPVKAPPPKREQVAQVAPPPHTVVETKPAVEKSAPAETHAQPAPASAGTAHLTLGAKPPCTVLINGQDTGKTTPVRDLEVHSGAVSVTLVNGEFGIRESFTVSVAPGENKKVIKDFTDRLPK